MGSGKNTIVYLSFKIEGLKVGSVVLELYHKSAPKTCENFRALCTGKGINKETGLKVSLKGSKIDRVISNVLLQGGDIKNEDGSGAGTIHGQMYTEENYKAPPDLQFSKMGGILAVVNALETPEANTSQFFITADACPHLEGTVIIFGKVLKGLDVVRDLTCVDNLEASPVDPIEVSDCGELTGELRPGDDLTSFDNDGTADIYPHFPEEWAQGAKTHNAEEAEKVVQDIRHSGNSLFKKKDFFLAQRKYEKAIRYIQWAGKANVTFESGGEQNTLCKLNLSATKLVLKRYKDTYALCSELINKNPNLTKAYFRRGQASFALNDYKSALDDLYKARELEPTDIHIHNEIKKVERVKREYLKTEIKMYQSMLK